MRADVPAPASLTQLSRTTLAVTAYSAATPAQLILGTATGGADWTDYVETCRQTDASVALRMRAHGTQLTGAASPLPGQLVSVSVGGYVVFNGVLDSVRRREARGERLLDVTLRRRDALPVWREVRRITPVYSVGTDLASIARGLCQDMGLGPEEYELPALGVPLAHDSTQLSDVTAWEILTRCLEPALRVPFVDALGKVKSYSKDVQRGSTLALTSELLGSVEEGDARAPLTTIRVKWLDPTLVRVDQEDHVLATCTLSAGFFKWHQEKELTWSQDGRQRADNVRLKIVQSINDAILPVGSEGFEVLTPQRGRVWTQINAWRPALATASLGALIAAHHLSEPVIGAATVPAAKALAVGAAETVLWMSAFTLGQGIYEVWGTPYDYAHQENVMEAYDQNAEAWEERREQLDNDLIPNEGVAQALAVNELLFRSRAATEASLEMADDLRVEVGDVLELHDGRRLLVTGYQRELSRGASPLLQVGGVFL